jgi:isopenicillin-N N-acyltransferase like protein
MTVPVHRFSGSSRAMGVQHGEELRDAISRLAAERIDIILSSRECPGITLLREVCEEVALEVRAQVPEVHDEAMGVADAANIKLWELIVAGGYSDVEHRVGQVTGAEGIHVASECTLVPARNASGRVLLAGTWDSHATAIPALVVIERHPESGPGTLALTTAGWPAQQGLNSRGLGFAIANMVPLRSERGIPYIAAIPRIAREKSARQGAVAARKLRLCSGRYYALCDESGGFVGLESDGRHYVARRELHTHTNHYVFEKAVNWEGRREHGLVSERRRCSAERRLREMPSVDAEGLFSLLRFQDGTPESILQVGEGRETRTGVCFVIDPARRLLWYAGGSPQDDGAQCLHLSGA